MHEAEAGAADGDEEELHAAMPAAGSRQIAAVTR